MLRAYKEFGKKNLLGGVIQLVNFLGFGVNNLLVPTLLGAHTFGLVAISLSLVYLLQGLFEVSFVGTTINLILSDAADLPEEARGKLRLILRDLLLGGSLCAVLLLVFADRVAWGFGKAELSGYLRLAALIVPVLAVNTFLLSLTYSRYVGHALVASVMAGVAMTLFPFLFCVVIHGQGYGAVAGVLATQMIFGFYLATVARRDLASVVRCRFGVAPGARFNLRKSYLTLVLPRLLPILINSGSILVVGAVRTGVETAVYKLALSITGAFNRLIPASPHVLQASIRDLKGAGDEREVKRIVGRYLMIGTVLSLALAALGYGLVPFICTSILGREHAHYYVQARLLSLSLPLLFLITLLPSVLLAWERVRGLAMASLFASVLYMLTGYGLIYKAGIKGAALALILATLLAAVWMLWILGDLFKPYLEKLDGWSRPPFFRPRAYAATPALDRDKTKLHLHEGTNKYEPYA